MPTIAQLERRIRTLEIAVAALQKQPQPNPVVDVQWRRPQINLVNKPAEWSAGTSGVIRWVPTVAGTALSVMCRIDGGPTRPAPATGLQWGPLEPGAHRADFYVGGNPEPEVSHLWSIMEQR